MARVAPSSVGVRPVRAVRAAGAVALAGLAALLVACGGPPATDTTPPASPAPVPPALAVPAGQRLVLTMTVQQGVQIYSCAGGAWSSATPAAVLTAPTSDALHTAGPRWIATVDGSAVSAAQLAAVPVPGAAPQLLLRATGHEGTGVFSSVDYVQRLATRGGQAPAGACIEGQRQAVGYTAEYRFYAPGS